MNQTDVEFAQESTNKEPDSLHHVLLRWDIIHRWDTPCSPHPNSNQVSRDNSLIRHEGDVEGVGIQSRSLFGAASDQLLHQLLHYIGCHEFPQTASSDFQNGLLFILAESLRSIPSFSLRNSSGFNMEFFALVFKTKRFLWSISTSSCLWLIST